MGYDATILLRDFVMRKTTGFGRLARYTAAVICLGLCFGGCATAPEVFKVRGALADEIARSAGLSRQYVRTDGFTLTTFSRLEDPGQPITFYIEGDGQAFINKHTISDDPTPRNPVGLMLAAADPAKNVVYLARPGQYAQPGAPSCDYTYWTSKRFSDEVITSVGQAVDYFKKEVNSAKIQLVGYSGGAAIAVLLAERRADVSFLRTVAGNLDPNEVNRLHRVEPFTGSLNPLQDAGRIAALPQIHFVGVKDTVVPKKIAADFCLKLGAVAAARVIEIPEVDHGHGWAERWRQLLLER